MMNLFLMKHLFLFTAMFGFSPGSHIQPIAAVASPVARVSQATDEDMDNNILYYINEYRKSIGLGTLKISAPANAQALQHSKDMAQGRTGFGHDGFPDRVKNISQYVGHVSGAAENVAFGQMSAKEVVDGWLHSPGHKKNIEGDYLLTGIGVAESSDGTLYFTQIFVHN